jgi:lysozyme family protein
MDRFDEFIERLLEHEGGYSADRTDPGNWTGGQVGVGVLKGTKFGIAANTYPDLDIANLTREQAKAIYRRDFWQAARCDLMRPAIAFQLLDGAVNSGIRRAAMWLQEAAGATVDGAIGPKTLGAVQATDHNDLCFRFLASRLEFMTGLRNWGQHGKGWARRIAANLRWAARDN